MSKTDYMSIACLDNMKDTIDFEHDGDDVIIHRYGDDSVITDVDGAKAMIAWLQAFVDAQGTIAPIAEADRGDNDAQ